MSLSLCIIAKNEEEFLERCINSVKSIVDEIIVVDTGSSDKTKEIAKSAGAKVFDFVWEDDFSKARNKSLEHATSSWILILDADEIIDQNDLKRLKELIDEEKSQGIDAYSFVTKNFSNNFRVIGWRPCKQINGFSGWYGSKKTRLFRNNKDYKFEGEIHELVDYSILKNKGIIKFITIPILHFQKLNKKKLDYYLSLSQRKVKTNPDNSKTHLDYANQNKIVGNNQIAIEEFNKVIFLSKKKGTFYIKANIGLGEIYLNNNELEKAKEYFENALKIDNKNIESHLNLGTVYFKIGNFKKAEEYLEKCLKLNEKNVLCMINLGAVYQKLEKYNKSIIILDKAISINHHNPEAFFNLGVAYGKLGDFDNALKTLIIALQKGYPDQKRIIEMINFAKQRVEQNQNDIDYQFKIK